MQTTPILFALRQLHPQTLKRRLKQLALTLGVLFVVIARAVALADEAKARLKRSHARREAQAAERLRRRNAAWTQDVGPLEPRGNQRRC